MQLQLSGAYADVTFDALGHAVAGRGADVAIRRALLADLHDQYVDLGEHEANVIDASGPPDEVVSAVLSAVADGILLRPDT